ncbi:hypothetical protein FNW52_12635 [Flavobacterium sp. ZT3R18]|uniref:hypothetical protein n=1 Tax=Flavobacterium sp. ZT3R18 TaxID=2594429 RepID=UPI00117B00DB|nr:hypothetical protein [Flavobacterium sp. ZT3R18]TRX34981.1 hypothetical protein FNW52_12635 [Flavobacterium sp. ZT3R18]
MIYLNPVGIGEIGNALGNNNLIQASNYYEYLKDKCNYQFVEPIFDRFNKVTNLKELVPNKLVVIPNILTVHTSPFQGSLFDNFRKHISGDPPSVTIKPSDSSVFVYAYNEDGKLICPLTPNMNGINDYYCTYEILLFGNHFNNQPFNYPFVVANEVDGIAAGYNKNKPESNPPHAIMVRARTAGKYSVQLNVRLNKNLIDVNIPESDRKILEKMLITTFEVNAIDNIEIIDKLSIDSSDPSKLKTDSKGKVSINLNENEFIDINLTGIVSKQVWNENNNTYMHSHYLSISLNNITLSYENITINDPNLPSHECLLIKKINGDGTYVRLTGGKLLSNIGTKGTLKIHTHGRSFEIEVIIK